MEFKKNMRFVVTNKITNRDIINLFCDLYKDVNVVNVGDYTVIYYVDDFFENIKDLVETIVIDFGEVINIHEAFSLNPNIDLDFVNDYINLVIKYNLLKEPYTNMTDLMYYIGNDDVKGLIKRYQQEILMPIISKNGNRLILQKYFDNNLNVLKTSKDLFINRNSLLLRLESLSKKIGYNVQDFKVASMILFIMNMK